MIKLIVTDMDGTLLSNTNRVCPQNLDAIRYAREKGVRFGIATGRDFRTMRGITDLYELPFDYAVLGNGAQFIDGQGNILASCYLSKDVFLPITQIFESHRLPYMVFTTNGYYAADPKFSRDLFIERMCFKLRIPPEDFQPGGKRGNYPCMQLQPLGDKAEFLKRDLDIIKVESYFLDASVIQQAKRELAALDGIAYLSSADDNVEVTNANAQKGLILEQAIHSLGLKNDEVMVLGDGLNDSTMFDLFPCSFAPCNGAEEIKQKAYRVVCSNNDGAVAEAIRLMIP